MLYRDGAGWFDCISFAIFLSTSTFTWGASAVFHLYGCLSERTFDLLLKVDLAGICGQIIGSYIPGLVRRFIYLLLVVALVMFVVGVPCVGQWHGHLLEGLCYYAQYFTFFCPPLWYYNTQHYAFMCTPMIEMFYYVTSLTLMGASVVSVAHPYFQKPSFKHMRTALLILTGGYGLVPLAHWCSIITAELRDLILPPFLMMFILYGVGCVFFLCHIPERFFPGRFDILLHSHQWWHLAVVCMINDTILYTSYWCYYYSHTW